MSDKNIVSIQLPEDLVKKAEEEGLIVSKSCELALKRRIRALKNIDSNDTNQNNSNSYNGNHLNHNHKVSFSKDDVQDFCDRLSAAGRSSWRVNAVKGKLEKLGVHVDWSCNLNDVTDYLNKRKEEVSNRTLSDDIQAIKQFFKDMNVY